MSYSFVPQILNTNHALKTFYSSLIEEISCSITHEQSSDGSLNKLVDTEVIAVGGFWLAAAVGGLALRPARPDTIGAYGEAQPPAHLFRAAFHFGAALEVLVSCSVMAYRHSRHSTESHEQQNDKGNKKSLLIGAHRE